MAIRISVKKTVDIDGNKKVQSAISNMLSSNQVPLSGLCEVQKS